MNEILAIIGSIFEHEGFMAVYGVIAWTGLHYALDKKNNPKLVFKKWRKEHDTDTLIMMIVALGMVIFDDEIIDAYNSFAEHDIEINRFMYLLPGFVTGRILKWMYKEQNSTT